MEVWKIISFLNGWFVGSMLIFQSVMLWFMNMSVFSLRFCFSKLEMTPQHQLSQQPSCTLDKCIYIYTQTICHLFRELLLIFGCNDDIIIRIQWRVNRNTFENIRVGHQNSHQKSVFPCPPELASITPHFLSGRRPDSMVESCWPP